MRQHSPPASVDSMRSQTSEESSMAALAPATKHYPVGLRYVQALWMKTEYRKCVQTCCELLQTLEVQSHPIQKSFLLFYSALAHDEMGRAMHHNSVAKIPALESAEQDYLASLRALPSPEDAELLCAAPTQESSVDPFFEHDERSPSHDGYDLFDKTLLMSSLPRLRRESFSVRSPSPRMTTSDLDELESHDSFNELMTPNRVLDREYSRMSLLENTPPAKRHSRNTSSHEDYAAPARMQRDFSRMSLLSTPPRKPMSQGLLRPIRPGSPPKQFYIPPRLADTSRIPLPRVGTQTLDEVHDSSPRNAIVSGRDSVFHQHPPEAVSPISRMGPERYSSDVSTISAISPLTPEHTRNASVSSDNDVNESLYLRFSDHFVSMRMQLETHITLVQLVKEHLRDFQAERASSRVAPTTGTPLQDAPGIVDKTARRTQSMFGRETLVSPEGLSRVRSYWSFVPEDEKAAEKRRRIQSGRERKWERKKERFDPTKYQDLCERALNEL